MSRALAESIAVQREIVAVMNLTGPEGRGRLLTDVIMRDPTTREPLNRGEMFDRHAQLLYILTERNAL